MKDESSSCPIQRILILYLNLSRLCTGKDLGEAASEEEWSEEILYYYQKEEEENSQVTSAEINNRRNRCGSEAVQFAGLCSALYNLPNAVKTSSENNDNGTSAKQDSDSTQEVQFDQSTLVFVPLERFPADSYKERQENRPSIIAVLQLARQNSNQASGGNPLAIRASIQKWHQLFCLLRGGGIHKRLSKNQIPSEQMEYNGDEKHKCPYPGMDQLFEGRKTLRKLRETLHRARDSDLDLEGECDNLVKEIDAWAKLLPISSLRADLKFHYDAYLGEFSLINGRNGGVGRCLVEAVPQPVAVPNGKHAVLHRPSTPPPHVAIHLGQAIKSLFFDGSAEDEYENESESPAQSNECTDKNPQLVAVSTFYQGQLLYNHDRRTTMLEDDNDTRKSVDSSSYSIYDEIAPMLMCYLSSYRFRMRQQRQGQEKLETFTPPRRLSHGLVSFSDHTSPDGTHHAQKISGKNGNDLRMDAGAFLSTPPLAMLSVSEQEIVGIKRTMEETVWAPLINLPLVDDAELSTANSVEKQFYAVLYEWKDFSFLLYISRASKRIEQREFNLIYLEKNTEKAFAALLDKTAHALSNSLNLLMLPAASKSNNLSPSLSTTSGNSSVRDPLRATGMDVIFLDRATGQMILSPRAPKQQSPKPRRPSSRGLLGAFSPSPPATQKHNGRPPNDGDASSYNAMDWAADGMDCRHWLASHLPLDSILAFDDAMSEIHRRRQRLKEISQSFSAFSMRSNSESSRLSHTEDGSFELFTSIPQGWLYAFADHQDREVYVLLDSNVYVTVADVQKAAMSVRAELFQDISISEGSLDSIFIKN